MALIRPFAALRPTPDAAEQVAAVPYDVVDTSEARALAADAPLSFLHVSRAEIDLPQGTDPYSDTVYETAASAFARLRAAAPLVVEPEPSLYFYRLVMGEHEQTGLAGCFSVDEYERDVIRKHERTRKDKEDDRTRHIVDLRAQTGPVFLTYQASVDVDRIAGDVARSVPLFDFAAADGIRHTVWRVPREQLQELVGAFARIPLLYIADGHHRAASAMRARKALANGNGGSSEADTFLAVAFPHDQTQILPYHRLVKDLNSQGAAAFLDRLRATATVSPGAEAPSKRGDVAMYLEGRWYIVTLPPPSREAAPADRLDVAVLQDRVLGPLLGIGDQRTDKRIDFVGGIRGPAALARAVDSGRAAVAFALYPVSVSDLMAIADAGGIMPPKSTWFEPKLRDGLLTHLI
jgi:uncharacterized protein (DUF1015 family)